MLNNLFTSKRSKKNKIKKCGFNKRIIAWVIDIFCMAIIIIPISATVKFILFNKNDYKQIFIRSMQHNIHQKNNLSDIIYSSISTSEMQKFLWDDYGFYKIIADQLLQFILLGLFIIIFWKKKQATPGKFILGMKIVDARTELKPKTSQLIIRFLGYIISALPFCLGFFWIIFNKEGKSWHDYLSSTKVIYTNKSINN